MDEYFQAMAGETAGHLRLVGELDLGSVPAFRAAVQELPAHAPITLDLAELTHIDSSGLHAIIKCANTLNGRAPVRIVNASAHVSRVLEIVRFNDHANIAVESAGDAR